MVLLNNLTDVTVHMDVRNRCKKRCSVILNLSYWISSIMIIWHLVTKKKDFQQWKVFKHNFWGHVSFNIKIVISETWKRQFLASVQRHLRLSLLNGKMSRYNNPSYYNDSTERSPTICERQDKIFIYLFI